MREFVESMAREIDRGVALVVLAGGIAASVATGAVARGAAARPDPAQERGVRSITADALLADVAWLAAPERDGRLTGSAGYAAAVRWAERRFVALGLRPGLHGGFSQPLTVEYNELVGTPSLLFVAADGRIRRAELGADFVCRGFTGSGRVTAPVAFVGYGVSLPERGYDDYAGFDATGKVILCLKPTPPWEPGDGEGWGWAASTPRQKAAWAAAHGALAMLWVQPPRPQRPAPGPIGSVLHGPGEQDTGFPQLEISVDLADQLLGGAGALAAAQESLDGGARPAARDLSAYVEASVRASYEAERAAVNAVALLPGADPALRDEYLVLGAHLDHVGRQSPAVYFPGANDNASGAAAVLALARAFVAAGRPPARSVVFVLFAAEEQGLNGAKHYVAAPPFPLDRTRAMFNFDCIAHGDSIKIGGGEDAPALWELARTLDAQHARLSVAATWGGGGADATPFHEAGVPTLYWVTTHSYTHLHTPGDTLATLDGALFAELVRLGFRTAWTVADAPAGAVP